MVKIRLRSYLNVIVTVAKCQFNANKYTRASTHVVVIMVPLVINYFA